MKKINILFAGLMTALLVSCASAPSSDTKAAAQAAVTTAAAAEKTVSGKMNYTPYAENCRLSDPDAITASKKLYNFICDMYGKRVITGMMENSWDDTYKELDAVKEFTGKYPALMGYDFMNYTGLPYASVNQQINRAMNFADGCNYSGEKISDSRGIIAFCWHWRDPMATDKQGSYKPTEAAFRIPYDTDTKQWKTETTEYKKMMADLDVIAKQLKLLQSLKIPVIWRPLHEGAGNLGMYANTGTAWFWWGAGNSTTWDDVKQQYTVSNDVDLCGECYIALWQLMYNYFTQTKGLHNLIWLWNGQNAKFYPGSEYVDIIGDDIYAPSGNYTAQKAAFDKFQAIDPSKPVALSECGVIPTLENMQNDNAMWSYFMVWNDGKKGSDPSNFWDGQRVNPDDHKKEIYNSPLAITLDQLPF